MTDTNIAEKSAYLNKGPVLFARLWKWVSVPRKGYVRAEMVKIAYFNQSGKPVFWLN